MVYIFFIIYLFFYIIFNKKKRYNSLRSNNNNNNNNKRVFGFALKKKNSDQLHKPLLAKIKISTLLKRLTDNGAQNVKCVFTTHYIYT